MDYELAKQLKEAGFPQGNWQIDKYKNDIYIKYRAYDAYPPTLSELIETCGENFGKLQKMGSVWYACDLINEEGNLEKGSTPEEAVAKLWLELNKKI